MKESRQWRRAEMFERRNKLESYDELIRQGARSCAILKALKISRATFYRWKRDYQSHGLYGLLPKSTKPHTLRSKEVLTKNMIDKIRNIRNKNPCFGRAKIHALLIRQGSNISQSSVNRALKYLLDKNFIVPVSILRCSKQHRLIRRFEGHSQKLPKKYRAQIQIDHTVINWHGKELRQFNAIEQHSRYCIAKIYPVADSKNASDFLEKIVQELPIALRDIQVDGGAEFRDKFESSCKDKRLALFVLPPRSPKINGKVERLNQTWKKEFYLQKYNELPEDIDELNKAIDKWQKYYNEERIHRALKDRNKNLLTPKEIIIQSHRS